MKTIVARTAGFCMGVKRAVQIAKETAANTEQKVYTLGELIHNKQVVSELSQLGLEVSEELPESGVVIIRAHGVSQECKDKLNNFGVEIIDATCPHVLSSQNLIASYSKNSQTVVILGNSNHPEVVGLCGYAKSDVFVVESIDDIVALSLPQEFLFIAQTTFSQKIFNEVASYLKKNYPNCKIVDSICDATQKRQDEAMKLSNEVDLMIVVGGKHSANTLRLVEIGIEQGIRVFHIEDVDELNLDELKNFSVIGITAGASTPVSAVEKVVDAIGNF